jgi:hypothetical protein
MRADRLSELEQTRLDYWREFVGHMKRSDIDITFGAPGPGHQLRAKADTLGGGEFVLIALANVRPEPRIGVGVEISGPEEYYAALERDRSIIEREIGFELGAGERSGWNPETKVRDVWLYRGADFFDRKRWQEQHEWLGAKLETIRKVLKPRIVELLRGGS